MMPKIVVTQPINAEVLARLMQVVEVVINTGPESRSEADRHLHLNDADASIDALPQPVDHRNIVDFQAQDPVLLRL